MSNEVPLRGVDDSTLITSARLSAPKCPVWIERGGKRYLGLCLRRCLGLRGLRGLRTGEQERESGHAYPSE
jgi:hypothetical protein